MNSTLIDILNRRAMSITMNGPDFDGDIRKMYIPRAYVENIVKEVVTRCAVIAHRSENHQISDVEILKAFDL